MLINKKISHSLNTGFSFGFTSGVITTLGLLVGVYSINPSPIIVIGSILTIAIADAFSDSLGIHISEESDNKHTTHEIWISTCSTFISKFIFALTFIVPFLIFKTQIAVILSIIWGITLISLFSYYLSIKNKMDPKKVVLEHLLITICVIITTYYSGNWISLNFR